jgi:hypothetical protein
MKMSLTDIRLRPQRCYGLTAQVVGALRLFFVMGSKDNQKDRQDNHNHLKV